jgi:hypothetical protein
LVRKNRVTATHAETHYLPHVLRVKGDARIDLAVALALPTEVQAVLGSMRTDFA